MTHPADGTAPVAAEQGVRTAPAPGTAPPARARQPEPDPPAPKEPKFPSLDETKRLAAEMQEALSRASREPLTVDFRADERHNGYVLEIRNKEGDLIRQFPPEKVLNLRSKLDELSGVVVDETT
ncbi:flagellar protein FlaG [bacterium]|nr:flagellar protein FlaG [bacterium]